MFDDFGCRQQRPEGPYHLRREASGYATKDAMRDQLLAEAKRIVIKIGSSLIASRAEGLRPEQIDRLAEEIAALEHRAGRFSSSHPVPSSLVSASCS